MYLGSTGERGLRHMAFEIADQAVNEVLVGRATSVDITLTPDGGVRVADDGPGVPIDEREGADGPGLEDLLTHMQAGVGTGGRYDVTLGFCGVGPAVVNALSRRTGQRRPLDATSRRTPLRAGLSRDTSARAHGPDNDALDDPALRAQSRRRTVISRKHRLLNVVKLKTARE
ncbi:ATP-binding protein [Streptomyces sp. NPDC091027]|uniref:ATP-binding protein n=1 Tax=Streptomyces sp. NPDC091027 TaxID=3365971 RepID=UPI003802FAED